MTVLIATRILAATPVLMPTRILLATPVLTSCGCGGTVLCSQLQTTVRCAICLRACCAMSGTDRAYGAPRYMMPGTERADGDSGP
eukprot:2406144-Rhodomonas_salina.1